MPMENTIAAISFNGRQPFLDLQEASLGPTSYLLVGAYHSPTSAPSNIDPRSAARRNYNLTTFGQILNQVNLDPIHSNGRTRTMIFHFGMMDDKASSFSPP